MDYSLSMAVYSHDDEWNSAEQTAQEAVTFAYV